MVMLFGATSLRAFNRLGGLFHARVSVRPQPTFGPISYPLTPNTPSLGGSGTLSALTLGYPSPNNANPTSILIGPIGSDWQSGDVLKLAYSSSSDMSSPTILTHTLTDSDTPGGSITFPLPTFSGNTYFVAFGAHSGTDSQYLSNMVAWGSAAAPVIATSATQSHNELTQYAVAITANEALSKRSDAVWISGGADQTQFEVYQDGSGNWFYRPFGNGTFDADNPTSVGGTNAYSLQITVTDEYGNTAPINITETILAIDKTPDAFSLGADVGPPLTAGQTYQAPNLVTLTGVDPVAVIPWTVTNGTAQQNGTGAYASSGTWRLGDTLQVEANAPSAGQLDVTLASNGVSDTWSLITSIVTAWDPANSGAGYTYSNGNKTATRTSGTGDSMVRATATMTGASGSFDITFPSFGSGNKHVGLADASETTNSFLGHSGGHSVGYISTGTILYNGSTVGTFAAYTVSDKITVQWDGSKVYFYKNGTLQNTGGTAVSLTNPKPACSFGSTGAAFTIDATSW